MFVYYLFAILVVALDQVTKHIVVKTMAISETIPLIEGVFHITSHRNRGAAFGLFQEARWFFIVVTIIVVGAVIWYLPRMKGQRSALIAFSLFLGGAVGNFIDRLMTGEVVDFLDFRLINFPIFNVADSAIVIGVILLLLNTMRESRQANTHEGSEGEWRFEDER